MNEPEAVVYLFDDLPLRIIVMRRNGKIRARYTAQWNLGLLEVRNDADNEPGDDEAA